MYISSIIKFRTTSERDAAIALDKAVNDVSSNSVGTLEDIKAGVERASWYSSCLFDKYDDVCSGLKGEDRRFIKAIFEIYKRRDIIADMIRMYIEAELKTADRSEIQSIDAKLAKNLVGYSGGKLTKTAIANSLSILIVNAFHFKNEVLVRLNKYSIAIVTVASFYGKVQVAALAARRLRQLSPGLYQVFYSNNIEMLYFLMSDSIDKALINSTGLSGEERFISIIRNLAR
ncbi:hypothetical protein [Erwinia pyrifoliae]|uniref:hypothetical protein n=1 Tax=Erwinia pyrifoliae TaxID=79967 RepID=UPI0021FC653C|nr:hypothetical protein [Erwinia pyrifoliae]MCT2385529.1 hypothetical protein [Erwinia pyrifoliae]MCU8588898.1 hypothetical protein [Erwinia pyrifoliae]UWS29247.1 hypothetical protein NYP81_15275 [Erwinia pyrifoliae]